ncbi:hypothetical protein [Candidatus Halocynthiibacter alkanivorans]|uniref:hypothetical protein n=1 Tax=Candidatus Halocynthiibacter alkanivorans TaxID=2267619 RepID=UPI001F225BAD|nr:hypothetical protein [Candidatus Halocynthiibacter alkanivorans]
MTLITPLGGEEAPELLLEATRQHLDRAIRAFQHITAQVEAGHLVPSAEARKVIADLQNATQTAFDERKRLEEQLRKQAGVVHDYALDFDQARDEVRRRLARLAAC